MKRKKNLKRKRLIVVSSIIVGVLLIGTIIFLINRNNKNNGVFSVLEQRWLEKNASQVVDISVLNDVPIFGYEGSGVFFDFMEDFSDETGIKFNMVPYKVGSPEGLKNYAFITSNNTRVGENEVLFYTDNYVLISKDNTSIKNLSNLNNATIGVLDTDLNKVKDYLDDNSSVIYNTYNNIDSLVESMNNNGILYAVIPKTQNISYIFKNNYYIAYNFNELVTNYNLVINGDQGTLNDIISKYYTRWKKEKLSKAYNTRLLTEYFEDKSVDDASIANFSGKEYVYGYVKNLPYDSKINDDFIGYNSQVLDEFAESMNITFKIKEYNSVKELVKNMNEGKVDIVFDYYDFSDLTEEYDSTSVMFDTKVVALSSINDVTTIVPSLKSLQNSEVIMLEDKLSNYFKSAVGANPKTYKKVGSLFNAIDDDSLIILDYNVYNYYRNSKLDDYKVIYETRVDDVDYDYLILNNSENRAFNGLFKFYISSINQDIYMSRAMLKLSKDSKKLDLTLVYILIGLGVLLVIGFLYLKYKSGKYRITKTDRLKYVDSLTSLKNRHYLNKNYEKWQQNRIYPQAVIIVDVNKIGHINDVYGHQEGDNTIKKAANVLINNQLEQSDIVRTNGDEFLIYMVGYAENKVIAYIRKLHKEFKNLPYGYGATLGYSMIEDDVKTIDDAINEAVLEVKTNKEMNIEEK
ncbi:MAG: GGDEF domain-containing protein [Bacilli bacterium]|jgi:diguanylate cyclase (GGDEF)-like protein|nr:GGDEF domain-containing protein [Bacilli bacterium]